MAERSTSDYFSDIIHEFMDDTSIDTLIANVDLPSLEAGLRLAVIFQP